MSVEVMRSTGDTLAKTSSNRTNLNIEIKMTEHKTPAKNTRLLPLGPAGRRREL